MSMVRVLVITRERSALFAYIMYKGIVEGIDVKIKVDLPPLLQCLRASVRHYTFTLRHKQLPQ
jgi:hypothetical protein